MRHTPPVTCGETLVDICYFGYLGQLLGSSQEPPAWILYDWIGIPIGRICSYTGEKGYICENCARRNGYLW